MSWPPLVDEVDEVEDEVEVGVEEEEVMVWKVRPAQNGCHLDSGGSWRRRGQQGHPQLVGLAQTKCHLGL